MDSRHNVLNWKRICVINSAPSCIKTDVLIVGGGLIGAALMRALEPLGLRCILVDAPIDAKACALDARSLALSPASMAILKKIQVWPAIQDEICPISTIHISAQARFGQAKLHEKLSPLGAVVDVPTLGRALYGENIERTHVDVSRSFDSSTWVIPARVQHFDATQRIARISHADGVFDVQATLVVAADGSDSPMRHWCGLEAQVASYAQVGLVTNVALARDHENIAYERFTDSGSMALLPLTQKRMALVWILSAPEAQRLQTLAPQKFIDELQRAFGYRAGRFLDVGSRVVYPLKHARMPTLYKNSVVFIGNAAHTLHPVAGQGFNLGLRDVSVLTDCLRRDGLNDLALGHYAAQRGPDHQAIRCFTSALIRGFSLSTPGVRLARSAGLLAFDHMPIMKNRLAYYAGGFAGQ